MDRASIRQWAYAVANDGLTAEERIAEAKLIEAYVTGN